MIRRSSAVSRDNVAEVDPLDIQNRQLWSVEDIVNPARSKQQLSQFVLHPKASEGGTGEGIVRSRFLPSIVQMTAVTVPVAQVTNFWRLIVRVEVAGQEQRYILTVLADFSADSISDQQ